MWFRDPALYHSPISNHTKFLTKFSTFATTFSRPMARPQRVLMLLAGVSLLLNRAESFNVPRVFPRAGVRRVAANERQRRRATRMAFPLGQADSTTLAREVARIAVLPVLLLMVRRRRTSATITTFARSSDTEKRTDTHVHAELKHAAMRSSLIACNTYFKIINEDYPEAIMPHSDDHDRSAQEQLEARARRGQHSSRDPGKTQTLRRGLYSGSMLYSSGLYSSSPPGLALQRATDTRGQFAGTITVTR